MKVQMLGARLRSVDPTKTLRPIGELKARGSQRPRGDTWMNIRDRVLARDKYTCQKCGTIGLPSELEADHIVPLCEGGAPSDMANLQALCIPCHKVKSSAEKAAVNSANSIMRAR